MMPVENWEGHDMTPSEHRTVGSHRAFCHGESEWCYPDDLCRCCLESASNWVMCGHCEGTGYVGVSDGGEDRP